MLSRQPKLFARAVAGLIFPGALLELSVSRLLIGAGAALMAVVAGAFVTPGVRAAFRSPCKAST